jgi:hypothetical protein
MVGSVDAGRIVDGIGVDAPAVQRIFHAPALGEAEIGALADHLGAHLRAIDPEGVVRAVADFDVGLARRLHIGADPAQPEQVDRERHHRLDQLGGRGGVLLHAE